MLELGGKQIIELPQDWFHCRLASRYAVQLFLHLRCEANVEHGIKMLDQQVIHREAKLGRNQLLLRALDVFAFQNGGDDRRVGAWTPNPILLERPHQRCFRVSWWGLCEVLLWQKP